MAFRAPTMIQQAAGMFGAPSVALPPSVTDVALLERTCRTALFGVSRIVSVHLGLSLVLLLVAFILLLGGHPSMSHTIVNFSTALLTLAALIIVMDVASGKGFFNASSMNSRLAISVSVIAIAGTWLMHNLFDTEDVVVRIIPMGLLLLAAAVIAFLRYTEARVDEQYINAKASLPGYMRPYRNFIRQLDAQIDNAIFSGRIRGGQENADAVRVLYNEAKDNLTAVLGRFSTPDAADWAVKAYLSSAATLLADLGAPDRPAQTATTPQLAQLAARNLEAVIRG